MFKYKTYYYVFYVGEEMICSNATASNDKVKISYDSGRKLPGTYEVNVEGLGEYEGKISKSFKIKLATTEIRDLTKNTNCFNVKWKTKTDRQVTGYQVRYSKTSGMKNYTTKTVKSYKTGSLKVDGLQNGQKYYVKVRTYKKTSDKTLIWLGQNTFCIISVHYIYKKYTVPVIYDALGLKMYDREILSETLLPFFIVFAMSIVSVCLYNIIKNTIIRRNTKELSR